MVADGVVIGHGHAVGADEKAAGGAVLGLAVRVHIGRHVKHRAGAFAGDLRAGQRRLRGFGRRLKILAQRIGGPLEARLQGAVGDQGQHPPGAGRGGAAGEGGVDEPQLLRQRPGRRPVEVAVRAVAQHAQDIGQVLGGGETVAAAEMGLVIAAHQLFLITVAHVIVRPGVHIGKRMAIVPGQGRVLPAQQLHQHDGGLLPGGGAVQRVALAGAFEKPQRIELVRRGHLVPAPGEGRHGKGGGQRRGQQYG